MNPTLNFMRVFFMLLSIFFMTTFMISCKEISGKTSCADGFPFERATIGVLLGLLFGGFLIVCDRLFRKFNLRAFNIIILGIFIGYLMGQALVLVFHGVLIIGAQSIKISPHTIELIKVSFFLFGIYLGALLTMKAADEFYISLPFVKFAAITQRKRDLLLDGTALSDPRIILMAQTGLFDHQFILPSFVIKELYNQLESSEESTKKRARNGLDHMKALEEMSHFGLRINETDFPEIRDSKNRLQAKLFRLARLLDANILIANVNHLEVQKEDVKVINLHALGQVFKASVDTGTVIEIKILRVGQPGQGVGYLDDGTMVVVNGAHSKVGSYIKASVISEKATGAGLMIFCKICEEEEMETDGQ